MWRRTDAAHAVLPKPHHLSQKKNFLIHIIHIILANSKRISPVCVCFSIRMRFVHHHHKQVELIKIWVILVMRQESRSCVYLSSTILSYSIARRGRTVMRHRPAICIYQFASAVSELFSLLTKQCWAWCVSCKFIEFIASNRCSFIDSRSLRILLPTHWTWFTDAYWTISFSGWDCLGEIRPDCFNGRERVIGELSVDDLPNTGYSCVRTWEPPPSENKKRNRTVLECI